MPTSEKIKERIESREKRLKAENVEAENTDKNNEKKDATIGKKNRRENICRLISHTARILQRDIVIP